MFPEVKNVNVESPEKRSKLLFFFGAFLPLFSHVSKRVRSQHEMFLHECPLIVSLNVSLISEHSRVSYSKNQFMFNS